MFSCGREQEDVNGIRSERLLKPHSLQGIASLSLKLIGKFGWEAVSSKDLPLLTGITDVCHWAWLECGGGDLNSDYPREASSVPVVSAL